MADEQRRRNRHAESLARHWDALTAGEPAPDPGALDADEAAFVAYLVSQARRAQIPAGARERARRELLRQFAQAQRSQRNGGNPMVNGITAFPTPFAPPRRRGYASPPATRRRAGTLHTLLSYAGTIALIAAILAMIFFAYRNGPNHAVIPAVQASPTAIASPTSDWPTVRGNPARTGVADQPGPTGEFGTRWTFNVPNALNTPLVAGDTVYIASAVGIVYAIDAGTGQQRWAFDMGSVAADVTNYPPPVVGENLLYAAAYNGTVYALNRGDGTVRWTYKTGANIDYSLVLAGDTIYVGDHGGTLSALDAANGSVRWTASLGHPLTGASAVVDGVIYQIDTDGGVYALEAGTGKPVWSKTYAALTRVPAVSGGYAYSGSNDGHLYALDAKTGTERWSYAAPAGTSVNNPAVDGGIVVFNVEGVGTVALDAESGAAVWNASFDADGRAPVIAAGIVYVDDSANRVRAFDLASGREVGGGDTPGEPGLMALAGGVLYVPTQSGTLTAFVTGAAAPASQQGVSPTEAPAPQASPTPVAASLQASHLWTAVVASNGAMGAIVFAPDSTIWVLDLDGTFWMLDRDGNQIGTWGTHGNGPGQFDFKLAGQDVWTGDLQFAADGSFFVSECGNARVERFDAQRKLVGTFGTKGSGPGQFLCPGGMVIGKDGDIFVADYQRGDVQRFHPDGTFVANLGRFQGPQGLALDGKGNIIVSQIDGHRIDVVAPDGTPVLGFGTLGQEPGQLYGPIACVVDEAGNFYVAETFNHRISVFDPTGKFIGIVDEKLAGPEGFGGGMTALAYGGHGSLYAAGFLHGHVEKFKVTITAASGTPVA